MDERSLSFVKMLIEKTNQGKISWSTGFEDGQFKTLLPGGKLAFVVQVNGPINHFMMLDDRQEVILQERIDLDELNRGIPSPEAAKGHGEKHALYRAILELNKLARAQALQVDDKLAKAEELLAAI
jgi:hypothetical protein